MPPPNMKQMIPEAAMCGQMQLHFTALGLLLAAVLWPPLAQAAGLAFSVSCLWLEWNRRGAARVYARFRDKIRARLSLTSACSDTDFCLCHTRRGPVALVCHGLFR